MSLPDPLDHHARDAQVLGQGPDAPVGPGEGARLQGGLQDALLPLRGEDATAALAPGPLAQGLDAPLDEGRPRGEHRGPGQPGVLGDRVVRHPLAGQEDHLAPLRQPLRRRPGAHQGLQLLRLGSVDCQWGRRGEHAP